MTHTEVIHARHNMVHIKDWTGVGTDVCAYDHQPWPCDTHEVRMALFKAEARIEWLEDKLRVVEEGHPHEWRRALPGMLEDGDWRDVCSVCFVTKE